MKNSRPALCIVSPFQSGGGAEFQIQCLIEALVRLRRFRIYFLAHYVEESIRPDGVDTVRVGGGGRMPRLGYTMEAASLYAALRRIRPDVIYQRVACGYTGICGFYARRNRVRLIWHAAHDTDVSRDSLSGTGNALRRRLEKASVTFGIARAHKIVVQTGRQAELLRAHYGRIADRIVANFHPHPLHVPVKTEKELKVLWVANLKPWKQPEVFVRLAHELRVLGNVRFVMVGAPASGTGDRGWHDDLMQTVGRTENLDYLGHQSHDAVNELLARAHLFVNTSVHEGFPNTFIQAWMRRVPVISLHVDPDGVLMRERIGVLANTERQLGRSVREFLIDPEMRSQFADRALAYASANHSLSNANILIDLIDAAKSELDNDDNSARRQ